MDVKSRTELAERIKQLALLLAEAAGELEYYGGFDAVMRKNASDLDTAALLAWGCFESLKIGEACIDIRPSLKEGDS